MNAVAQRPGGSCEWHGKICMHKVACFKLFHTNSHLPESRYEADAVLAIHTTRKVVGLKTTAWGGVTLKERKKKV